MNIKTAIQVLEHHNNWRRGAEIVQIDPPVLSKALDFAIDFLKSHSTETPDDVIKAFTQ